MLFFAVASVQTGQVVAYTESAHFHHGQDDRSPGKPDIRTLYYHLHLCRHGNATVRQELHRSVWRYLYRIFCALLLHKLHRPLRLYHARVSFDLSLHKWLLSVRLYHLSISCDLLLHKSLLSERQQHLRISFDLLLLYVWFMNYLIIVIFITAS